ncbi:ABC transporter ATP-binding protein [Lottiidibacillus patelloidae]|uniref:ABC transporter ATP-binding protein n=1 Tax=Lottiidibacillus patelloidae TaxID=2670334 RepID=A0A263BS54_9BACI|nr:ABC transporter ATP-binding protein [Lottiidibacillus patelloidae]OZM56551.1 ABC transporter ATP-binding protein [Lottiidibacillus patelloidae]
MYGKQEVLSTIELAVNKGEIFGILGPSGAGKTTLVKIIAGIEHATTGRTMILSSQMPNLNTMENIGYMAQSDALYNELTALENLKFFGEIYGLKGKELKQRISKVLEIVNLTDHVRKNIHQYSGGMKRRLSLAIALLHEPDVLILDEPTVGIDPVLRQQIWAALNAIRAHGTTILVTTHVMDEAEKCDKLAMLRDGKLIAIGSPQALKDETSATTIEEAFLTFGGARG